MITHSWFRLDEVLPLAQRAVACPAHGLRRAQVLAGMPLGPALIWTATDRGDTLISNGVPAWYDQTGQEHAAAAWTWRHTGTGRCGSAAQPGYHTAYLPLDAEHGEASLIARLREARQAGRHWVAVAIDPAGEHLITADAVRLLDHREEVVPRDAAWSPAVVTAAAVGGGWYPALIADGYRVLGRDGDDDGDCGVIARFDRATVDELVADLIALHADTDARTDPMPGEFAVAGFDRDALVVWWEYDDGQTTRLVEIDRVYPDPDGLFAVGAYLWPWCTNATSLAGSGA